MATTPAPELPPTFPQRRALRAVGDHPEPQGIRRLRPVLRGWLLINIGLLGAFGLVGLIDPDSFNRSGVYNFLVAIVPIEAWASAHLVLATGFVYLLGARRNHILAVRVGLGIHSFLMLAVGWSFLARSIQGGPSSAIPIAVLWLVVAGGSVSMMSERIGIDGRTN